MGTEVEPNFKDGMKAAKSIVKKDGVEALYTAYADEHRLRCEAEERSAELGRHMGETLLNVDEMAQKIDEAEAALEREKTQHVRSRERIEELERQFETQDDLIASLVVGMHAASSMAIREKLAGDRYVDNLDDLISKLGVA